MSKYNGYNIVDNVSYLRANNTYRLIAYLDKGLELKRYLNNGFVKR